jgi:hypothetical protein
LDFEVYSLPAVGLLVVTSLVILVSRDWRLGIGSLGLLYVGVFILVAASWPPDLAVVKLVAGWMAGSVLGITRIGTPPERDEEQFWPSASLFRLLAASLVILAVISLTPDASDWIPDLDDPHIWGGMVLIGMGLLKLGLTAGPLKTILGMLMVLSGFEILYASVESSTLVAGLLAAVTLAIALAGSYLMVVPSMGEVE